MTTLYTSKQAASMLGITSQWLSHEAKEGKIIPSVILPSGYKRYTAKDIQDYKERKLREG